MSTDEFVEFVEKEADREGLRLSKEDWIDACEQLADNFKVKAEVAKEEMEDE